ncbi:MAG TPA: helix-turn-helix domain-containing protein [Mycobacteriales bacterium]|nr:helix-turn-helix domain-containing protein [Mycobacteriales bacterium]
MKSLAAVEAGPSPTPQLLSGSRLSEAVFGLRHLRDTNHPYVDSAWFRAALSWCATADRDLIRAICAAPHGVPEFLLDRIEESACWPDQLYGLIAVEDGAVGQDLRRVFADGLPPEVMARFASPREGLAEIIRELDHYVTTVLEPMWLPLSMSLTSDVDPAGDVSTVYAARSSAKPPTIIPTVLGIRAEAFDHDDGLLVCRPVERPGTALYGEGRPRLALAQLLGYPRTVILYALEGEMTAHELARATGQRRKNTLHHLRVLARTHLVTREVARGRAAAPTYRRTALGAELLGSQAQE